MQRLAERDYFTDYAILKEPYAFFDALREHGPVFQPPGKDYFIVTGFDETLEVLKNHDAFSAVIGLQGGRRSAAVHASRIGHNAADRAASRAVRGR
jgi:cytochrome P450